MQGKIVRYVEADKYWMVEFQDNGKLVTASFNLEKIRGKKKISFSIGDTVDFQFVTIKATPTQKQRYKLSDVNLIVAPSIKLNEYQIGRDEEIINAHRQLLREQMQSTDVKDGKGYKNSDLRRACRIDSMLYDDKFKGQEQLILQALAALVYPYIKTQFTQQNKSYKSIHVTEGVIRCFIPNIGDLKPVAINAISRRADHFKPKPLGFALDINNFGGIVGLLITSSEKDFGGLRIDRKPETNGSGIYWIKCKVNEARWALNLASKYPQLFPVSDSFTETINYLGAQLGLATNATSKSMQPKS